MAEVTIEKGIPIPAKRERRSGKWGSIISKMTPGDSFVCLLSEEVSVRSAAKSQSCMVTARCQGDGSVRFWLVSSAQKEI